MKILVAILVVVATTYFARKKIASVVSEWEDLFRKSKTEKDISYVGRSQHVYSSMQTEVMGQFEITVYRPNGSIYKRVNLPNKINYFSVGSSPHDDLVIPDRRVSRSHLLIGSDECGMFLRDNQSTNGTRKSANGKPCLEDIDIEDNLEIYLGPIRITFQDCLKKHEERVLRMRTK